jgi:hypothetical protein
VGYPCWVSLLGIPVSLLGIPLAHYPLGSDEEGRGVRRHKMKVGVNVLTHVK